MKFDEWYNLEQLAECQADNKRLRDALEFYRRDGAKDDFTVADKALCAPSDSTALDIMIKEAKRRVLLDAANWFETVDKDIAEPFVELRRMAEELK